MIEVPIVGTTIPHEITGVHGAGQVFLKPAPAGTGIIAGGPVRNVVELAGIKDIVSKSQGSNTPINIVRATFKGLEALRTVEQVAELRGKINQRLNRMVNKYGKTVTIKLVKSPITHPKIKEKL